MTTDMYRFKKEKETVKMEDTEEGNMKYKTHDTPCNNNNKEKKKPFTFGGCSHMLMRHCLI